MYSLCIEYNHRKPIRLYNLQRQEATDLSYFHYAMGAREVWVSTDGVCYISTIDFPTVI